MIFAATVTLTLLGFLLAAMIVTVRFCLVRTTPVTLTVAEQSHTVASGNTVLATLHTVGIPVPSPCGGKGSCHQCKVQVCQGAQPPLELEKGVFNRKQLSAGWRLSCQHKVRSAISIAMDPALLSAQVYTATVVSNCNVATFIKELVVQLPKHVDYRSGSYFQLEIPPFSTQTDRWEIDACYQDAWKKFDLWQKTITVVTPTQRAYSLASYPAEGTLCRFTIRIATPPIVDGRCSSLPWGIGSSYAFSLKEGDRVTLKGPYGESFMKNTEQPVHFLIGGAGASFGRSHILHLLKTEKTNRRLALWYGARSLKENIYEECYRALAKKHSNFTYHLVLSEPADEDRWERNDPVRTGYLYKAFELGYLQDAEEPEEELYYVCGPPLHNKSVMALLDQYGVPRHNIVLDDFGS